MSSEVIVALQTLCQMTQEDRDCNSLLEEIQVVCKRAVDTITLLSREKVITGELKGGMLTFDDLPEGVVIHVKDRSLEDSDFELEEDEEGEYFALKWWGKSDGVNYGH